MLRRAKRLQSTFNEFCSQFQLRDLTLSQDEWRQIEYLLCITQPFFKFTTALCKSKDTSIHLVFEVYKDQTGRIGEPQAAEEHQHHAGMLPRHKMAVVKAIHHFKSNTELVSVPPEPLRHYLGGIAVVWWVACREGWQMCLVETALLEFKPDLLIELAGHAMLLTDPECFSLGSLEG
jgi:hypothetical protein